jgi:TonB-linked SusC/RagA family outer membrane protein
MENKLLCKIFFWRKFEKFTLSLILMIFYISANAQNITVKGTVTDSSTNETLIGVNVLIKGSEQGAVTDANGNYTITVPNANSVLVFSYVGYENKEIQVGNNTVIDVKLSSEVKNLQEVVVVGYGVQRRTSVTGAITPVSSKDINQLSVASVQSALQGRAAGVSVVNQGGPGTDPLVRIRGIGSITYGADPLYVIDGTPATNLSAFDNADIESVEVLKDASATAIYGSRAANGVILITTKKGKKDNKIHVGLDSYVGSQMLPKKLDLLNTQQYIQYATALNGNAGLDLPTRLKGNGLDQPIYDGATKTYRQINTDWQDALFQNAFINDNNVSISSGGDKSNFYASMGYFNQEGIMVGTNFKRSSFRFNSDHNISKHLKFGQTLNLSYGDRKNQYEIQGRPNIMHTIRMVPYMPVTVPNGVVADGTKLLGGYRSPNSGIDGNDAFNPVEVQKLFSSKTGTVKLFGNIYAELSIFEFLKFRSTVGLDYENILNSVYQPIYNDGFNANSVAFVRRETFENVTKMFTNQLTFDKTFGKHNLNIIAVQEQTPFSGRTFFIYGSLPTNAVKELTGASIITANGSRYQNTLLSYLGRVNYEFANKYFLSASMRADGSSKFATGHKWGYFPAASIGWRIKEEGFMKDINAISELKFRLGYGELGNNGGIGNYAWKAVINSNTDYVFNNAIANGSYFDALDNLNLQWETSKMTNVGIDFGMFGNKLTLTAEYFDKNTDNLILNLPYAPSIGYLASYPSNVGKMNNHGFEFQLAGQINKGILKSSLSANISFIKNKVLKLSTPTATIDNGFNQDYGAYTVTRTVKDQPIQSFYGWKTDGIFKDETQVSTSPKQVVTLTDGVLDPTKSTAPGDIKFKDLNKDGVIDDKDRTFIGSYLPKFTYGLNYTGTIANFDFSLYFQGVYGNKIYNGTKVLTQGMLRLFNAGTEVLNAWSDKNKNSNIPRAISGDPNQNARASDRFIENGSYLRLKVLTIGYNIPTKLYSGWKKGGISTIRIYATAQNLLTFTSILVTILKLAHMFH